MNQGVDEFGIVGNTIRVAAGHLIDLAEPDPQHIDLYSIASALSKICRFGGHTPQFYSVAEHSIHATVLATRENLPDDILRAILLHDAAEAFIGDMVKPLKVMVPKFVRVEKKIEQAIQERFQLDFRKHSRVIKRFDQLMLKLEKTTMWPKDKTAYPGFADVPDARIKLPFWNSAAAFQRFMTMAEGLGLVDEDQ